MMRFAPAHPPLATAVRRLRERRPPPALSPGLNVSPWDPELNDWLQSAGDVELLGVQPSDVASARAVRAGLLLWNDALGDSHVIAQSLETADGSYWHAIMHRREGDLSNSGYWFNRTGKHPVYAQVLVAARDLLGEGDDPGLATCRAELSRMQNWEPERALAWCRQPTDELLAFLKALQIAEIEALLDHCYVASRRPQRGMRPGDGQ